MEPKRNTWLRFIFAILVFLFVSQAVEAKRKKGEQNTPDTLKSADFAGLKWRGIGPAFTSGRIADFAVNPLDHSEYYVAVASGHVWKTVNNGTTFKPIFDNHGAYSMGCIVLDPTNPNVVWLGTGENNHQRALGYGNGVYRSEDGGESWTNMGLKESRQIGNIVINPKNSNIVYVAAEGSVWGPGGDRGLYKTTDGGKTWKKSLEISENTGVNNIVMDPRDPNVIYATSEQRCRRTFTKIGGGPESAVYKTTDGGDTWVKIMKGLPSADIGGTGIAISPADPEKIYLIMEAADGLGGFFRSTNRGASWTKMSDYYSSGQYYNEIYCDPVDPEKVYSMETVSKYTEDGGRTWKNIGLNGRHVDDHAMWIDPDDTKHFMIGGDGGIYETFDSGTTWIFKSNLPVTQFYRVNVDDTYPFYWVYGGTQDNNSFGGPSQNTSTRGVASSDWVVTLGGDGFWQAIEPGNPDIVYSAYQYGNISRYDKKSGESIEIKPQPGKDELTYRWNWDAPFILSPHSKTRLYMGANKLFRSDDRGNSWKVISDDLTRNEDRNQFMVMGKYWPSNAVAKDVSTSLWGTIVTLAESPLKENLIYVGTDDGLIQVTEDSGINWKRIDNFPGVPAYTYVSDICPSTFDENIVFASFNNIKSDDFRPYLLKSNNKGHSWTSITGNLPANETIHTIIQDPVNPDLLFIGTEFSVFFTPDGGKIWIELSSGIPDIAVKDMVIQQRDNDLVVATFGRGFYILDDYSALREINQARLDTSDAIFFPVADALMYIQTGGRYGQGSTYFTAPNPDFGAVFTYFLGEVPKTKKQIRIEKEKELFKEGKPIPQPTRDELLAEAAETDPLLILTITGTNDDIVRQLYESPSKGIGRVTWNLRYQGKDPINKGGNKFDPASEGDDGMYALPGKYKVKLFLDFGGELKQLAGPVEFNARPLNNTTLPADDRNELVAYQDKVSELSRVLRGIENHTKDLISKTESIRQAIHNTPGIPAELANKAKKIKEELLEVDFIFNGTPPQASSEEVPPEPVSINQRLNAIAYSHWSSTSSPTQTQLRDYDILKGLLPEVTLKVKSIDEKIIDIEKIMESYKAPWTPGRIPELK